MHFLATKLEKNLKNIINFIIIILFTFSFKIGYCDPNINENKYAKKINIETTYEPMTLREILKEIEKQSGIKTLMPQKVAQYKNYYNISFDDMTLQISLNNINVHKAIKIIEEKIQYKYYSRFYINMSDCLSIHEMNPNTDYTFHSDEQKFIKIKHITASKMKKLIREKIPDAKVAVDDYNNAVIYLVDNNKNAIRNIIETNDNNPEKLDDLRITLNTNPNGMKIPELTELMKQQIGNHIKLDFTNKFSTIKIKVSINNEKLKDAIDKIIEQHNSSVMPHEHYDVIEEIGPYHKLNIRKEDDAYAFYVD